LGIDHAGRIKTLLSRTDKTTNMKNLKFIIGILIFSSLIFSCNKQEIIEEKIEPQTQEQDLLEAQDGATLILDEVSARMSFEERKEYYANLGDEKLAELLTNHFSNDLRNNCNYKLWSLFCNWRTCINRTNNYYPDWRIYYGGNSDCWWAFCSYSWNCH